MNGLCKKQRWHLDEVGHHGNSRKKKAYKAHFNRDLVKEWAAINAKSHKGDTNAFCRLCRCDFSVSSGESKTCSVTSLIVTRCHHYVSVLQLAKRLLPHFVPAEE